MKKIRYALLVSLGCLIGVLANRNREYLVNAQFIRDHLHFRKTLKDKEDIVKSDKVMVVLTIGQSNAANFGDGSYTCKHPVYNYYKGDLYMAKDPILGANGPGCSVWTRVADRLIDSGLYKKVILVPCAIGSTSVQCWAEGDCKAQLLKTLAYLKKDNIELTHIFWDQGETDNVDKTTKAEYKKRLKQVIGMIRAEQPNAVFFSTISSYFPFNNDNPFGISAAITAAQHEVIAEDEQVKLGPNTDDLNLAYYRQQDVHFTSKGLDQLAGDWVTKIKENK